MPQPQAHSREEPRSPGASEAAPAKPRRRLPRSLRIFLKVLLGLSVLFLAFVAVIALIVFPNLTDEPEFLAPDLVPAERTMPPEEENAAIQLIEIANAGLPQMPGPAEDALWEALEAHTLADFLESDEWAQIDASYWQPMQPILAQVDAASALPFSLFPEPISYLEEHPIPWIELREIAFALRLRTEISTCDEDSTESIAQLLAWGRFIDCLAQGSRTAVDLVISQALLTTFLEAGIAPWGEGVWPSGGRESEARLMEVLAGLEFALTRVSEALRIEHTRFREFVLFHEAENLEWLGHLPWWQRALFLPQRTLRKHGEFTRVAIAEGEAQGAVKSTIDMSFDFSFWHSLREGNGRGRVITRMAVTGHGGFYTRAAEVNHELLTLRVQLALTAYEREHGALPPSLQALVPTYFAEVPVDFWSKKPLSIDRETRTVTAGLHEFPATLPLGEEP